MDDVRCVEVGAGSGSMSWVWRSKLEQMINGKKRKMIDRTYVEIE